MNKNTGYSRVQTEMLKSSCVLSYAGALGLVLFCSCLRRSRFTISKRYVFAFFCCNSLKWWAVFSSIFLVFRKSWRRSEVQSSDSNDQRWCDQSDSLSFEAAHVFLQFFGYVVRHLSVWRWHCIASIHYQLSCFEEGLSARFVVAFCCFADIGSLFGPNPEQLFIDLLMNSQFRTYGI